MWSRRILLGRESVARHDMWVRRFERVRSAGWRLVLSVAIVLVGLGVPRAALAVTLPAGFTHVAYATGLTGPDAMAFAPDGRIFVTEKAGSLRVIKNGSLLSTPFVTVTVDVQGERGLLGVTLDPDFATNRYVYVYYTATTPTVHNRVSRFVADGDVARQTNGVVDETIILELNTLGTAQIHNGGAIHFGPDGKLYIATGDAGTGSNSQSLTNLFGKILRINADGTIPSDNPLSGQTTGQNRAIWALGLRNPFTFAFQPGSGRMFINDVGQSSWEEINDGVAGANYGWPVTEGPTTDPRFRGPVYAYPHESTNPDQPVGCAITGGAFYNPPTALFPAEYVGAYFFADFCNHWIKRYDPVTGAVSDFATSTSPHPVDLWTAVDGGLYYLARGTGSIIRIGYTSSQAPVIGQQPADVTVAVGQPATFTVEATGATPLSYQWQRNGVNISGATSASYTLPAATLADDGAQFRCVVSNSAGTATSNSATLRVINSQPPNGTITAPPEGTTYKGGDIISYAGTGSDPEDGDLPPSAFTWQVDFHHADHVHPYLPPTSGATSGQFTIANTGHTDTNVWYRINLTVRDSAGLTHTSYRDITPRTATITLATEPAGLQLLLDDQPRVTPYSEESVEGIIRRIGAPSPQTINGVTYEFASWSDGGAATHDIVTPSQATTYTATFRPVTGMTLTPVADTYANEAAPTTNFGTSASLAARGTSTAYIPYLRFTLPAAPTGQVLTGATLRIRTSGETFAGSANTFSVQRASDSWTETGLTWNNRPPLIAGSIGTVANTVPNTVYQIPLSVSAVQAMLGTSTTLALSSTGTDSMWFSSRNATNASYRPQLSLTFAPATSTTLTPLADTYANEAAPTTNFGTSASLAARGTSTAYIPYLRFTLPAAPTGQVLTGATLRIRTSGETFAGSANTFSVQRASDSWTETGLTWNNRPPLIAGSIGTVANTVPNTVYQIPLSVSAVQAMLGTSTTLALSSTGTDSMWFSSRNATNASYRPQLVLTFG
jgi:glucose/arabinose dehydrogenase